MSEVTKETITDSQEIGDQATVDSASEDGYKFDPETNKLVKVGEKNLKQKVKVQTKNIYDEDSDEEAKLYTSMKGSDYLRSISKQRIQKQIAKLKQIQVKKQRKRKKPIVDTAQSIDSAFREQTV